MELDVIDTRRPKQQKKHVRKMTRAALQRRKKRRRIRIMVCALFAAGLLALLFSLVLGIMQLIKMFSTDAKETLSEKEKAFLVANDTKKPEVTEMLLTLNPYSRPGIELPEVNAVFVHYTANQGTSAMQNRSYFENLGITHETSASAHFIIGIDGEIIQCIPLEEIGYAVKQRNYDSVSIECCYEKENGEFSEATYESLLCLCAWLLKEYELTPKNVLRHYDEGGKKCPLYYVENQDAWEQFLIDLEEYVLE